MTLDTIDAQVKYHTVSIPNECYAWNKVPALLQDGQAPELPEHIQMYTDKRRMDWEFCHKKSNQAATRGCAY